MRKAHKLYAFTIALLLVSSVFCISSCRNLIFIPVPGYDTDKEQDISEQNVPAVIGVAWDYSSPDTELFRLYTSDDEALFAATAVGKTMDDPLDLVTVNINEKPVPYHTGSAGSSPFDAFSPWSGMVLVSMGENGRIIDTIEKDETIASFVQEYEDVADLMVYLPEMFYRVVDDPENSRRYYYVGNVKFDGAELHPASAHYIARYDSMNPDKNTEWDTSTDKVFSRPSDNVAKGMTLAEANAMIANKGNGYHGLMLSELSYVQLMYLVEYADMDFQRAIGVGQVSKANHAESGTSDLPYHTGTEGSGTDTAYDVHYRYIEGLLGLDSTGDYINGIVAFNTDLYFTDDIDVALSDLSGVTSVSDLTGWTYIGKHQGDGYITGFMYNKANPWLIGIAEKTEHGGSDSTYATDKLASPPAVDVLSVFYLSQSSMAPYDSGAWYMGAVRMDRIDSFVRNKTCRICYGE